MGRHEQIIPLDPPAARAPAVLARRGALERELADLKLQIPEMALAAYERRPGGRESLAALDAKIRACTFLIDCAAAAHGLAARLDEEATVAWKAAVQNLDPEEIVAGITKDSCCRRCQAGAGCVITASDPSAGPCAHPVLAGALALHRYQDDPKICAVFSAACAKLGIRSPR
jgi:hypothetical protein